MEMLVEVILRTALSNFVRVHCKFFGQFGRLVRTKIRLHYNKIMYLKVKNTLEKVKQLQENSI